MVAFELPQRIANRITRAAQRSGRTNDSIIREGILRYLDDLDDIHIAEVMKVLLLQQREKPLSFSEKRMLERSRRMLVGEISIARRIGETEAIVLLQKYLGKAALSLPAVL